MASYSFNLGTINPNQTLTGMWKLGTATDIRAVYALAQPLNPGGELITFNLGKLLKPDGGVWLVYSIKNIGNQSTNVRFDWGYA